MRRRDLSSHLFPIYFIILGAVAFVIYNLFLSDQKEEIIVSQQTIEALIQRNQELNPVPLTDTEIEALIQGYIDDEVLINEARKVGIDRSDGRVRKRMLQVMRSTLSERVPDPTFNQLQQYYKETIDRYTTDSSRSFVHVYFEFTNKDIPPLNVETIQQLNSTNNLASIGDYFGTGNRFPEYSFKQTVSIFGRSFAEAIFNAELDRWYGPVESNYGYHYIYVFGIHDPKVARFEDIEAYLKHDYLFQKAREQQQERIEEMKKNYEIVIEDADN